MERVNCSHTTREHNTCICYGEVSHSSHVTFLAWPYKLVLLAYIPISAIALAWEKIEDSNTMKI